MVITDIIYRWSSPHIKNWWAKSSTKRAQKRLLKINFDYERILHFTKAKDDLIIFIVSAILESLPRIAACLFLPLLFMLPSVFFPGIKLFTSLDESRYYFPPTVILLYIFFALATIRLYKSSLTVRRVRNFDTYKLKTDKLKALLKEIADREL